MNRLWRLNVLVVVMATLLAVPAAAGSKIVTLTTTGGTPDVHVAPDGTVHAVWDDPSDSYDYATYYCRMKSPTSGCAAPLKLETPAGYQQLSPPRVFVLSPGTILVVATRSGGFTTPDGHQSRVVFSFLSTDGGATFSAAKMIGTAESSGDMIADAGNVYIISDSVTGGTFFQAAKHSSGSFTSTKINLSSESSQAYDGALALHEEGGTTKLVAAFSDLKTVFYRVWSGSGSPNDISTWGPVHEVAEGQLSRLAHGPGGVFLLHRDADERYVVRPFTGESFGDPAVVSDNRVSSGGDFFQDTAGRLHVLKTRYTGGPVYRTSMDGIRWSPPVEVVSDERFDSDGRAPAAHANELGAGALAWTRAGSNAILRVVRSTTLAGRCALALQGTAAADEITGRNVGESLFGLQGNDTLAGGGGPDCVFGGAGNDVVSGGARADRLFGGAGNDKLNGRDGARDYVNCGSGAKDVAIVDKADKVKGCETVKRG